MTTRNPFEGLYLNVPDWPVYESLLALANKPQLDDTSRLAAASASLIEALLDHIVEVADRYEDMESDLHHLSDSLSTAEDDLSNTQADLREEKEYIQSLEDKIDGLKFELFVLQSGPQIEKEVA
jgi:chromosome segregation ATPase